MYLIIGHDSEGLVSEMLRKPSRKQAVETQQLLIERGHLNVTIEVS